MNILEYSSSQYRQVIPRESKMLEYVGYLRIFKLTKLEISGNSKLFFLQVGLGMP